MLLTPTVQRIPAACPTTVCRKWFHSSNPSSFPIRRRRRGDTPIESNGSVDGTTVADSGGDFNRNALQHQPVQDTQIFQEAVNALFDKLERALTPMKAKNDTFIITRSQGDMGEIFQLDLGPKEGSYQIYVSEEEHVFEYSSPISGKILYCLSASTGNWVGVDDGNAFEGILVRDLIRQCQGLPNL